MNALNTNPTRRLYNLNTRAKALTRSLLLTTVLLSCGHFTLLAQSGIVAPGVYQPNSTPYGQTYSEWSVAHWQWEYAQPFTGHPLTLDGNVNVGAGQPAGPVWFLGGTFAVTTVGTTNIGMANRTGTVPLGTALFFPMIDAEDSFAEEMAGVGCYAAGSVLSGNDLRRCAQGFMSHVTSVFCTIDGVPVKNTPSYQFVSKLFTFGPLPADNLLAGLTGDTTDFPAGLTTQSVSDGFFVMVAPLSAGSHTLHFGGTIAFPNILFVEDITYHLTVQ